MCACGAFVMDVGAWYRAQRATQSAADAAALAGAQKLPLRSPAAAPGARQRVRRRRTAAGSPRSSSARTRSRTTRSPYEGRAHSRRASSPVCSASRRSTCQRHGEAPARGTWARRSTRRRSASIRHAADADQLRRLPCYGPGYRRSSISTRSAPARSRSSTSTARSGGTGPAIARAVDPRRPQTAYMDLGWYWGGHRREVQLRSQVEDALDVTHRQRDALPGL